MSDNTDLPSSTSPELSPIGTIPNSTAANFTTTSTTTTTFTASDLPEVDESNVAPLHLHAIRIPARLQGIQYPPPPQSPTSTSSTTSSISSTIHIAPGKQTIMLPPPASTSSVTSRRRRSRSRSRSRPSSRSTSRDPSPSSIGIHTVPSLGGVANTGSTTPSGGYGGDTGSLESPGIIVDADILLDRLGIEELECPGFIDNGNSGIHSGLGAPTERGGGIISISTCGGHSSSLPSVNERMSEESMDDCHAFTDLKNVIRQSGLGTSTNCSVMNMGIGINNNMSSSGVEPSKSRDGSVTGGSILGDASCLLETLEEFEEEGSSDCDEQEAKKDKINTCADFEKMNK